MIVLDASTLIAFLDPTDALHPSAVATMRATGPRSFGVSPLTHAEVLVGPTRAGTLEPTQSALAALNVTELGLPADAAPRLAMLRATTRLKLPDCCVILAAQQSDGAILTLDDRLDAVARRLGVGIEDAPSAG